MQFSVIAAVKIIMSTHTSTSSKEKDIVLDWEEVIQSLRLRDKAKVCEALQEACTPLEFFNATTNLRRSICKLCKIEGWDSVLYDVIEKAHQLPTPSEFQWDHVPRILVGSIPKSSNELTDLEDIHVDMIEMEQWLQIFEDTVRNKTEAEAAMQVFTMLWNIIIHLPQDKRKRIKLMCQPSVEGHPNFTDFQMVVRNGHHLLLIEVKNRSLSANLAAETPQAAQVLREVQILSKQKSIDPEQPIAFVLTNSTEWSFAIAIKKGAKIEVTKHSFVTDMKTVYKLLMKYLMPPDTVDTVDTLAHAVDTLALDPEQ